MSTDLQTRWENAIHESAHAVVAHQLGCEVVTVELGFGVGACEFIAPTVDDNAYATAAGPIAEEILRGSAMPLGTPVERVADSPTVPGKRYSTMAATTGRESTIIPDDVFLARWAICGFESDPSQWSARVRKAKSVARRIVSENIPLILRVAKALFLLGVLTDIDLSFLLPKRTAI